MDSSKTINQILPIVPQEKKKDNRGGFRPGSGRKKGYRSPAVLEEEIALARMKDRIVKATDHIMNSQISIAVGQQFLYKIEKEEVTGPKGGKSYRNLAPKLVTNQFEIEEYLAGLIEEGEMYNENDPGATYYYLTTKEPNNMAIEALWNRVHGKPKESVEVDVNLNFSLKNLGLERKGIIEGTVIDEDEEELLENEQPPIVSDNIQIIDNEKPHDQIV